MKILGKEFDIKFDNRIGLDKKSPKARLYQKPLSHGKSDWETALLDFKSAVTKEIAARKISGTDFI